MIDPGPETKKKNDNKSIWEKWEAVGQPCFYVAFHDAVPTGKDKEPVGEFRLATADRKYKVDHMVYTPYGLVFWAHDEGNIVGLANIKLVRFYT